MDRGGRAKNVQSRGKMKLIFSVMFLISTVIATDVPYQSQYNQDKFIHENFFPEKKGGVFVEIGAYDGKTFSNTYFFEKKLGWKGLCIEPNPQAFSRLKDARDAICIHGCISENPGTVKFLQLSGYCEMLSGIQNKYDPAHEKRIETELKSHGGAKQEIEVPAFTLNDLALEYKIDRIDYLSIDTEGGEWDILNSINFDLLDIDVISIENNYGNFKIREFLGSKGYVLIKTLESDEIYKKKRIEVFQTKERPSLAFIQQFLSEDPIIVEAGAHIGTNTSLMSKQWKKGVIYAFEPSPAVYKKLNKRCQKKKNVKTFQLALGKGESSISVKMTTLDTWAKKEGVKKVDFLWLDMQGSTLSMLKASPGILKTVRVIQTEVSKRSFYEGSNIAHEMQSWLEGQGFVTIYMTPGDHGDALFVRKDKSI
jgi:FkbM family methyltransferase